MTEVLIWLHHLLLEWERRLMRMYMRFEAFTLKWKCMFGRFL